MITTLYIAVIEKTDKPGNGKFLKSFSTEAELLQYVVSLSSLAQVGSVLNVFTVDVYGNTVAKEIIFDGRIRLRTASAGVDAL